jgi:VanZ family protein
LKKIKPSFIPGIIWLIISTILLTIPGSALPKEDWLSKIYFDKWVHIGMFCTMCFLWCWALTRNNAAQEKRRKFFIYTGIACLVYGIGMEFVQRYFIPNRSFDTGDIIADGAGATIGMLYSMVRYIKK